MTYSVDDRLSLHSISLIGEIAGELRLEALPPLRFLAVARVRGKGVGVDRERVDLAQHHARLDRAVPVVHLESHGGVEHLLLADTEAGAAEGDAEGAVTPFVAIEPSALWQHGYTEATTSGAGLFPLTFAATTSYSFPTFLGAQLDTQIAMGDQMLAPYLRASWVHEFSPDRKLQATFLTLPGAAFTVAGPRAARDAARIEAGARWTITPQALLFANLTGEFSDRSQGYTANGGLRVTW